MLCEVSTSNGATMPGKITMSDKPRIGSTSGTARDEICAGAAFRSAGRSAQNADKFCVGRSHDRAIQLLGY